MSRIAAGRAHLWILRTAAAAPVGRGASVVGAVGRRGDYLWAGWIGARAGSAARGPPAG